MAVNTVDYLKNIVIKSIESNAQSKNETGDDLVEVVTVKVTNDEKQEDKDYNDERKDAYNTSKGAEEKGADDKHNILNQHEVFGFYGDDRSKKPPEFWVQYNTGYPYPHPHDEGGGYPLQYTPDRNVFVRIVLSIVFIMLLATTCIVGFVYVTSFKDTFLKYGLFVAIPAGICMIFLSCCMNCVDSCRRPPCNIIALVLAVFLLSIVTSYATAKYNTEIILYALIATGVVVLVCVILACSSFDFTQYFIYFAVIATVITVLIAAYTLTATLLKVEIKPISMVISFVTALINCVFLIMELQMILGGKTVQINEDDYALAAFMIYNSIVHLFISMLHLFGED